MWPKSANLPPLPGVEGSLGTAGHPSGGHDPMCVPGPDALTRSTWTKMSSQPLDDGGSTLTDTGTTDRTAGTERRRGRRAGREP